MIEEKDDLGILKYNLSDEALFKKINSNMIDLADYFENIPSEMLNWAKTHPDPICEIQRMARFKGPPEQFGDDMNRLFKEIDSYARISKKSWKKTVDHLVDVYCDLVKQRKAIGINAPVEKASEELVKDLMILISKSLKDFMHTLPKIEIKLDHGMNDEDGKEIPPKETPDPLTEKNKLEEDRLHKVYKDSVKKKLPPVEKFILEYMESESKEEKTQKKIMEAAINHGYKISQSTVSRILTKLKKLDLVD